MGLNDRIVELRKQRGMSQEELAERLNVSRQAVSRWETGTAMPDAANLLQLSRIFGVSTDYLLGAEPPAEKERGKPPAEDGRVFLYLIILNKIDEWKSRTSPIRKFIYISICPLVLAEVVKFVAIDLDKILCSVLDYLRNLCHSAGNVMTFFQITMISFLIF